MLVELRDHVAKNVITKKLTSLNQFKVYLDGKRVGFIGKHEGAKLCLVRQFDDMTRVELELQVGWQLGRNVSSVQAPSINESKQQQMTEAELYGDELDS